jgi:hypothetical protein
MCTMIVVAKLGIHDIGPWEYELYESWELYDVALLGV